MLVASSPVCQAPVMPTPGANRSTAEPWLEDLAAVSVLSTEPTVSASVTRAGEKFCAGEAELPAATA